MKKILSILCVLFVFMSFSTHAIKIDCKTAQSTYEMMVCEGQKRTKQEKKLQEILGDIVRTVKEKKLSNEILKNMKDSYGAWLDLRKKHCQNFRKVFEGGTLGPLQDVSCQTKLTKQAVENFSELLTVIKGF